MIISLANAVSTTGARPSIQSPAALGASPIVYSTFQAVLNSGTSATVAIEGSNDDRNWVSIGTITLTTSGITDGFVKAAPWAYIRANITALSGNVTVTAGM